MSDQHNDERGAGYVLIAALVAVVLIVFIQNVPEILAAIEGVVAKEDSFTQWLVAGFNGIGVIVSATAVYLVWRTLQANKKATEAAIRVADTAQKSLGDTRELARAHVEMEKLSAKFIENGSAIVVHCEIRNTGQTPARNLRCRTLWAGEPAFSEEWWEELDLQPAANLSEGSLGACSMVERIIEPNIGEDPSKRLSVEQVLDIKQGHLGFWVLFKASYDDVFGKKHFSYSRLRLLNRQKNGIYYFSVEPSGKIDT